MQLYFYEMSDKSDMPMLWQGVGLTLSYSFLGFITIGECTVQAET